MNNWGSWTWNRPKTNKNNNTIKQEVGIWRSWSEQKHNIRVKYCVKKGELTQDLHQVISLSTRMVVGLSCSDVSGEAGVGVGYISEPTERQATVHTLHALILIVFGFLMYLFLVISINSIWPHMATPVKKFWRSPWDGQSGQVLKVFLHCVY